MRTSPILAAFLCSTGLWLGASDVAGQPPAGASLVRSGRPTCRLHLDPRDVFTRVAPPPSRRGSLRQGITAAATSTITVNYTGFSPEAQAAFQYAVSIWQDNVSSTIPIVVDARFRDLGNPSLLGQAGPGSTLTEAVGVPNTWYPIAIANRISQQDRNTTNPEVFAEFNSTRTNWYFGTDGFPPGGTVDFVTVVLHELTHGLGFIGAGTVSGGVGTVRALSSGGFDFPYIYDRFTQDVQGNSLLEAYPDDSAALASTLTGGQGSVSWGGTHGVTALGTRPPLYSPTVWEQGSSYVHLDEGTFPPGALNSLMTPRLALSEAIHHPGPVTLGVLQDMGWGAAGCTYVLSASSATATPGGGPGSLTLTTQLGCAWTATSNAGFVTITSAASGTGSVTVTYTVAANPGLSQRVATLTIAGQSFTITQFGTGPTVAVDKSTLRFAAVVSGSTFLTQTTAQTVRVSKSGSGAVTFTATPNQPWLVVSPSSGTLPATLTVTVQPHPTLPPGGTSTGAIALAFDGAGNSAGPVSVALAEISSGASSAPFGSFDTPIDRTTGISGSIPVTGWVLDDVQVSAVRIYRDPVAGELGARIFVGNAVFVDGARPDVAQGFPLYPRATRAGWGYLMLTNFLPNAGNGTFQIHAYAYDVEGHEVVLGTKTISVDNASATTPFGAIDTPGQGEIVSGSSVINFGWVLAPGARRADPPGGGTVRVVVDGAVVGSPSGWTNRSDLTSLFPAASYPGVGTALGVLEFSTAAYSDGVHTIEWGVVDNTGGAAGIGSRYFTIASGGTGSLTLDDTAAVAGTPSSRTLAGGELMASPTASPAFAAAMPLVDRVSAAPAVHGVRGRRGHDEAVALQALALDASGRATLEGEELDRFELAIGSWGTYTGYLRVGAELAPLPIGSRLDRSSGTFTWQPGVGFIGNYDLVFVQWVGGEAIARHDVRIVLHPKGSNRVGPQVIIDTPTDSLVASGFSRKDKFLIAGWAIDPDDPIGTGVDTVHVWAYPVHGGERGDPSFLGAATYGGLRPDVAAIYGERFRASGYGLYVDGLAPGTYDLAVFAWSTACGGFVPAKVVRVAVN